MPFLLQAAEVLDSLIHIAHALQELQAILPANASLEDVEGLVKVVRETLGATTPLEEGIQYLVELHLARQLAHNRRPK